MDRIQYGPKSLMAGPSLKNGGSGAHYRWGQSAREVTIAINAGSRRGRDFRVEINRSRVSVAARSCGDEWQHLLRGELQRPVLTDECEWSVEDGSLIIALAKDGRLGAEAEWWTGVLAGEDTLEARTADAALAMSSGLDAALVLRAQVLGLSDIPQWILDEPRQILSRGWAHAK
ncbi:hypothetical protein EMIHUDRAFT_220111 [Emiliania huxleyi CCMP1516]|uniref:CS domain-containing protein n=2 Tax=Emiliania huxleyi TaxID=2903 RepID=A0A0D3I311_EMIH1|nr:hypothetical protein EMIHUDRAFT_220111 [Emiliania huxleyi CCMP1516]EOD05646.1 hypothetical protein EMIHUDRAFT_220111 [Emiliania huxleyi CCMP1516]|eukprot:XP_005758075.1 hypothetical protein EMIHUDRAFT_220111 [Emiliania huxleyi CCMP1516]